MRRAAGALLSLLLLTGLAFWAYRGNWFPRVRTWLSSPQTRVAESGQTGKTQTLNPVSRGLTDSSTAASSSSAQPSGGQSSSMPPPGVSGPVNLLSPDLFPRVESVTTGGDASKLFNAGPWSSAVLPKFPQELVFSFFNRQSALVGEVILNPATGDPAAMWAKDVEVWTSLDSPTGGFTKAGSLSLRAESVDQPVTLAPVEARYLKVVILSSQGAPNYVELGSVKAIEGKQGGYISLLQRNPDLAAILAGQGPLPTPAPLVPGAVAVPIANGPTRPPTYRESRHVLVVGSRYYPPLGFQDRHSEVYDAQDASFYERIDFIPTLTENARPAMLLPSVGVDTIVLSAVCNQTTSNSVADSFKRALAPWVVQGHKLIITDSDGCLASDYSFLPYHLKTNNPGALGAPSDTLMFVEENTLGSANPADPAFLDVKSWLAGTNGNHNELGDSNTIYEYDANWCGHLFGTNVKKINGFFEAYTHLGRGLIIYDGFDQDHRVNGLAYRGLVTRELAQPFDPDGLPCTVHLGAFLLTTDERLKTQWMQPGASYIYPLTLLSNRGYSGVVKLTASVTPPDSTFSLALSPDTVTVTEMEKATLTVTTTSASPRMSHTVIVEGRDATGRINNLALHLNERRTGGIQIVSAFARPERPSRNLEIILDLSGSMNLPLGKSTRIGTARQVLRAVLAKLPDDFNVGLRFYGHRFGSRQKETCTDTELVLPIRKLDRSAILAMVDRAKPRGETPLVYSVLQTPADLKAVGGGSVLLITDGQESCGGDPKAAVQQLKAAGVDVTVNIVGFTLTGPQIERQLSALAEPTGGHYYGAQNGQALARAVTLAAIDKLPFTVFDASGQQVAQGVAGDIPRELPPGSYRVVVQVADETLTAERVDVALGGDTTLRVTLNGDRLALGR
jgi:von Willebrand factor type A domain